MKLVVNILCLVILSSCSGNKQLRNIEKEFSDVRSLIHKDLAFSEMMLGNVAAMHWADSKLIILDNHGEEFFHFIDCEKNKYLGNFGKRGQGPGDFLQPFSMQNYSDSIIAITDAWKHELIGINLKSLDNDSVEYTDILSKDSLFHLSLIPTKYDTFVSIGFYEKAQFYLLNKRGEITGEYFEYPYKDDLEKRVPNRVRGMAYQGVTHSNPSKDKLVYAVTLAPIINFYEIRGNSVELIENITTAYPNYKPEDGNGSFSAAMSRDNKLGYLDVSATDKYVYALYSGRSQGSEGYAAFESNEIFVFDWQGNPVKKYKLDVPVTKICVDTADRVIYAISKRPDPELVSFNL